MGLMSLLKSKIFVTLLILIIFISICLFFSHFSFFPSLQSHKKFISTDVSNLKLLKAWGSKECIVDDELCPYSRCVCLTFINNGNTKIKIEQVAIYFQNRSISVFSLNKWILSPADILQINVSEPWPTSLAKMKIKINEKNYTVWIGEAPVRPPRT